MEKGKPKLLLHVCCAPDATVAVERLSPDWEVETFFYNPNIHPREEYGKRLEDMGRVAAHFSVRLHEGPYDEARWLDLARDLMEEPERGRRCEACFRMRLDATAAFAKEHGFQAFAATLTVSPHKDAGLVNRLGKEAGERFGAAYLATDLKKKDGFKRSLDLSSELALYRQDYCGCLPSLKEREMRREADGQGSETRRREKAFFQKKGLTESEIKGIIVSGKGEGSRPLKRRHP